MPLNNPVQGVLMKAGIYTGDNTANRAILHGLGKTPKLVMIGCLVASSFGVQILMEIEGYDGVIPAGATMRAVTAKNSSNFYIGNAANYDESANKSGKAYKWVAFA